MSTQGARGGRGPQHQDISLGMCSLLKGDMMGYMGFHNIYGWLWVKYGKGLTCVATRGRGVEEERGSGLGLWAVALGEG